MSVAASSLGLKAGTREGVLLLCTTTRECPQALASALEAARTRGHLTVIFVLDPALVAATTGRLLETGFAQSEQSEASLASTYRSRAQARLEEIARVGNEAGLKVQTALIEGSFLEEVRRAVERSEAGYLIVPSTRRSQYARLITERSLLEDLRDLCAVREVAER